MVEKGQNTIKLQKAIAEAGLGSRRAAERWIEAGRVKVDGTVATLGDRVRPKQEIEIDGKVVERASKSFPRVLLLNKAAGVEVSRKSANGRRTVFDNLPELKSGRWINVGRLDVATTGLLILTDHGELVHRLAHPSTNIDREYAVRIHGYLSDEKIEAMRSGVLIDGHTCRFTDIRYYDGSGSNHWYHVCLMEGRNREVRSLFESQNILVSRLKRVRFGPFVLPSFISSGRMVEVHHDEVSAVCSMLSLSVPKGPRESRTGPTKKREVLISYPNLNLPRWYSA